jgi:AcrR family transcriptional regulator
MRTRRALQDAAMQLFAEQGYAETSVAEIAELAEIGERTFFVHFPTKEDVLFFDMLENWDELCRLIRATPKKVSDLDAIELALVTMHEGLDDVEMATRHRMTELLVRAAQTSSVVRGKRMEYANRSAELAAEALAERRLEHPPSLDTVTVAEVGMRMFFLSVTEWAKSEPKDLIPIIRRRFDAVRRVARDAKRI